MAHKVVASWDCCTFVEFFDRSQILVNLTVNLGQDLSFERKRCDWREQEAEKRTQAHQSATYVTKTLERTISITLDERLFLHELKVQAVEFVL